MVYASQILPTEMYCFFIFHLLILKVLFNKTQQKHANDKKIRGSGLTMMCSPGDRPGEGDGAITLEEFEKLVSSPKLRCQFCQSECPNVPTKSGSRFSKWGGDFMVIFSFRACLFFFWKKTSWAPIILFVILFDFVLLTIQTFFRWTMTMGGRV